MDKKIRPLLENLARIAEVVVAVAAILGIYWTNNALKEQRRATNLQNRPILSLENFDVTVNKYLANTSNKNFFRKDFVQLKTVIKNVGNLPANDVHLTVYIVKGSTRIMEINCIDKALIAPTQEFRLSDYRMNVPMGHDLFDLSSGDKIQLKYEAILSYRSVTSEQSYYLKVHAQSPTAFPDRPDSGYNRNTYNYWDMTFEAN